MKVHQNAATLSSWLSSIVQSFDDAIISKTLDGVITTWNPAAEITFGFTEAEAVGNNISIIIPENLMSEEANIIARVRQGEKINHYETSRRRKDGSIFQAAVTISPIRDENDIIIGATKIARDISEQKNIEQKEAILAAIIESSDDAIISKTLKGIIMSWNKGAEKIFGYTPEEVIGKHITIIIPEDRISEEAVIINKIAKGERISHFETIRKTKSGKEISISLTVSPVIDKKGKVVGASKVARDISEKVEMEKQRQEVTDRLVELNKYKDDFMAMASHELKTPLTVIKANMQLLEHNLTDSNELLFVTKTLNQVNKLSELISDLLDVSRIRTGGLELKISTFNFVDLLREVIENIQQTTNFHEVRLKGETGSLPVSADKERLEQVMVNLLTNAMKYSPNTTGIVVDAFLQGNQLLVKVKDWGIGIPEEDLDKVFTRFYRVSGLASTFAGSGIGLYISSEIINRHGGRMWVESDLGKGSTFYFTIPVVQNT